MINTVGLLTPPPHDCADELFTLHGKIQALRDDLALMKIHAEKEYARGVEDQRRRDSIYPQALDSLQG